jgi:Family of unknown function (DUF6011)
MTQFRITPLSRPIDNHAWMSAPITPERQAASEVWQKQRIALREQFAREWVPPPGYSAERDLEEMENIECAAFDVWEERRKGRTAAASTPVWMDAFEYWLIDGSGGMEDNGLLAAQPTAASLTLPIVLKGGGDMQLTFETRKYVDTNFHPEPRTQMESKLRLIVRTEHGVFKGHLERECGERNWHVVSLPPHAPQAVADRIAKTLDAINELNLADDYLAIMPVSDRCSICARPLSDIVSKTLGLGPDCADRLKIPHSASVADAIIVKRRAFLVEAVEPAQ